MQRCIGVLEILYEILFSISRQTLCVFIFSQTKSARESPDVGFCSYRAKLYRLITTQGPLALRRCSGGKAEGPCAMCLQSFLRLSPQAQEEQDFFKWIHYLCWSRILDYTWEKGSMQRVMTGWGLSQIIIKVCPDISFLSKLEICRSLLYLHIFDNIKHAVSKDGSNHFRNI